MIPIKLPTLLHASLWSVIGTAAAQLVLLAANAIAARLLGAQAYGAYGLTYNTASMVATIAATGVALVAARGVAAIRRHGTADDAREHARRCLSTALILSVALGLAVSFSATWFSANVLRNPAASGYLWAAAVLGAFLTNSQVRYAILAGLQRFRDLAFVRLQAGIVGAGLLAAACLWRNVYLAILAAAFSALLASWLSKRVFDKQLTSMLGALEVSGSTDELRRTRAKDWELLLPAAATGLVSTPVIWLCQAIVSGSSGGLGAIAVITVMSMWLQAIMLVPSNIGQPLLPAMMNASLKQGTNSPSSLFLTGLGLISASTLPMCAVLMAGSSFVLTLYGGDFSQHVASFHLLIITAGLQALSIPALILIQARGDLWIHFASNVIWAAIFISCTLAFKADGVLGYARASLISFALHACLVNAWAAFRLKYGNGE